MGYGLPKDQIGIRSKYAGTDSDIDDQQNNPFLWVALKKQENGDSYIKRDFIYGHYV